MRTHTRRAEESRQRDRENLVEDLQEYFDLLEAWGMLRPEWYSQRMEFRQQDIAPWELADKIRAGLERLRAEL